MARAFNAAEREAATVKIDDSLKARATMLSLDILTFLRDRTLGEPPLPSPQTWDSDVRAMTTYFRDTMSQYSSTFGAKAIAIQKEFAERGLHDTELDQFVEHPTNPIGVRIIGERIGALANLLPEE